MISTRRLSVSTVHHRWAGLWNYSSAIRVFIDSVRGARHDAVDHTGPGGEGNRRDAGLEHETGVCCRGLAEAGRPAIGNRIAAIPAIPFLRT